MLKKKQQDMHINLQLLRLNFTLGVKCNKSFLFTFVLDHCNKQIMTIKIKIKNQTGLKNFTMVMPSSREA